MISKIRSLNIKLNNTTILKVEDKKKLLSNFYSLTILQILNMVLPLLILPYLVRVLGIDIFGLISFVSAIIMYFNVLVGFGFDLSATREISIHRDCKEKISAIFISIMIIKASLMILSLIVLSLMILSFPDFRAHALLYYITFGIVFGNMLFPSWLFQGMENMKHITYINIFTRIICTLLILFVVREQTDFIYVPLLNTLAALSSGIYSCWIAYKLFDIKTIWPTKSMVMEQLKMSYHFFLSRVANDGSRYYATTLIGLYFNHTIVGYYSIVEKLFYAFLSLGGIISQTIYPYMSRSKNINFLKKVFFIVSVIYVVTIIPVFYYHKQFLFLAFNLQNELLSHIFVLVFIGTIFGVMSALIGYPLLAAFGYIKYANNSLIYASIFYMAYITIVTLVFKNISLTVISIPLYSLAGFILRVIYWYRIKNRIKN